jgi:hypothetical protein
LFTKARHKDKKVCSRYKTFFSGISPSKIFVKKSNFLLFKRMYTKRGIFGERIRIQSSTRTKKNTGVGGRAVGRGR